MKTILLLNQKKAGKSLYFNGIKMPNSGAFKGGSALNNKTQETFQYGKKEDKNPILTLGKILPFCVLSAAGIFFAKFLKGGVELSDGLKAISKYHTDKFNKNLSVISAALRRIL